ncbi:hypothetical protein BP6252_07235 [Coleophoma cylindrospora]|uniref:Uncharacterized protein n=1 Tax=Coleophoma cylindrospora TaxID=1849047 RepID=A0A3D8RHC5_9HELO|nr:hypothetical protein BP6252_07235 [Coleophoma cylindrospora]
MPSPNEMTYRPSALFPLVTSVISFALVLLLVLSGTRPDLVPDGYFISLNTTAVGQNLVQFNSVNATASAAPSATPSTIAARNIVSVSTLERLRILSQQNSTLSNSTTSMPQQLNATSASSEAQNSTRASPNSSNSTFSSPQGLNSTSSSPLSLNSTSSSPLSLNSTSSSPQGLNSTSPQGLNATAPAPETASPAETPTAAAAPPPAAAPNAAPALSIPSTAPAPATAATSVGGITLTVPLLGVLFQLVLNSLASGMGDNLKNIVSAAVTSGKTSLSVTQTYNVHLLNVCQGSIVVGSNLTNVDNPLNITRCVAYNNASDVITNLTGTISPNTIIAATNISIPILQEVPGLGRNAKSFVDIAYIVLFAFFIIALAGNALSVLFSVVAFFAPSNSTIHGAAAAITTISTMILQTAAFSSSITAATMSSTINKFSYALGLTATVGTKFLIFMWIGFIAAQMANSYWVTVWFVEYRKRSYKARERTPQEIGDYKNVGKELMSDIRLRKVRNNDDYPMDIKHL